MESSFLEDAVLGAACGTSALPTNRNRVYKAAVERAFVYPLTAFIRLTPCWAAPVTNDKVLEIINDEHLWQSQRHFSHKDVRTQALTAGVVHLKH